MLSKYNQCIDYEREARLSQTNVIYNYTTNCNHNNYTCGGNVDNNARLELEASAEISGYESQFIDQIDQYVKEDIMKKFDRNKNKLIEKQLTQLQRQIRQKQLLSYNNNKNYNSDNYES